MDWNLDSLFPSFRGPEMGEFIADLDRRIDAASATFATLATPAADNLDAWQDALLDFEEISRRLSHLGVYLGCLTAADSANEEYAAEQARISETGAKVATLGNSIETGLGQADDESFDQLKQRDALAGCGHWIELTRRRARDRMSLPEENLAAALAVDGIQAWGRLYNSVVGNLTFRMNAPDGTVQELPMAQWRSLSSHPDRAFRQAAFAGGNRAWESVGHTMKAAINGICGTRLTLDSKRGTGHFLDPALLDAGISRPTLDAMFEAIDQNLPLSRKAIRFKARRIGVDAVSWHDLEAAIPSPAGDGEISWETACSWVSQAFHSGYPALGEFFDTYLDNRWIDYSARPGKRPGGFCTTTNFTGESRVFMNFNGTVHDIMTLAHEIGHAFHSHILRDERPFAKRYPMTLAESASTFAELILTEGLQQNDQVAPRVKELLVDEELNHFTAFLLDIPVRFHFEKAFYERRASGELGISELNELMVATQRRIFGDTLAHGEENPWYWASKMHFFITGVRFYNFPYTFGYLLSRALHRLKRQQGTDFLPRYQTYLEKSGSMTCEDLIRETLGEDITTPEFWNQAIATIDDLGIDFDPPAA